MYPRLLVRMDSRISKRLLTRIALFLIVTACSLWVGEWIVRIHLFGWGVLSPTLRESMQQGISNRPDMVELPEKKGPGQLRLTLKPNVDTYFKKVPHRTNSQGLRDKQYTLNKPERTFRVVVIGDSYTMPTGVAIENAYHSLLEEELTRDSTQGITYEFINFGAGDYGLRDYLIVLDKRALGYDPDLILVGFTAGSDSLSPLQLRRRREQGTRRYPPFVSQWHSYYSLKKAFLDLLNIDSSKKHRIVSVAEREPFLRESLSALASSARSADVPIVLAFLSVSPSEPGLLDLVRTISRDEGVHFVDVSAEFRKFPKGLQFVLYRFDRHPNARANRIFADAIGTFLRVQGLLPEKL